MPARVIIGWLSEEDRQRYVRSHALVMYALSGNPAVGKEEAVKITEDDQALYAELRDRYEIDSEDTVVFGLFDGAICEGDEE